VFAVVQHEQELLVPQVGDQDLRRLHGGLVSEVQGGDHGVGHEGFVANLRQLDQPGAIGETTAEVGGAPQGKSGLPDTTRPDEADQAGGAELLPDLAQLSSAPDEARELRGQIARLVSRPGHGDYDMPPLTGYYPGRLRSESSILTMSAAGRRPQTARYD
jgi:hypothetical protein